MTDLTDTNAAAIAERYLATWNTTDRSERDALIAATWATDGRYTDPLFDATGHDAIGEMIAGFQSAYPDHRFTLASDIEEHHGRIRFQWQLANAAGAIQMLGTDVGVLTENGALAEITGFFDSALPTQES
ncbi:MAG: nuclear transport factor 2 family protein [Thermomicrobiales bacterium]